MTNGGVHEHVMPKLAHFDGLEAHKALMHIMCVHLTKTTRRSVDKSQLNLAVLEKLHVAYCS
jgi:hypothetical protein